VAQAHVDVPWLSVPSVPAQIAPGGDATIDVVLDAARVPAPGHYTARLLVRGNAGTDPLSLDVVLDVAPVPAQGLLAGTLRDGETGTGLRGFVQVEGGPRTETDATGAYTLTLPLRTEPYTLTARALGYLSAEASVALSELGATRSFSLTADLPRIALGSSELTATLHIGESQMLMAPIRSQGTRPLSFTASLSPDLFGVWPSGTPGGPAHQWVSLPDATAIALPRGGSSGAIPIGFPFPFYGANYTKVYIGANGLIGFSQLNNTGSFIVGCLPAAETPGPAIIPFRADLDPGAGGRIAYGSAGGEFVVSFENVPLAGAPDQHYSFQMRLAPSGVVTLAYGDLAAPPLTLTAGVQRSSTDAQELGCGRKVPVVANASIELRPQDAPTLWASASADGILAPGASAAAPVTVHWARSAAGQLLRATLVIVSNDPYSPTLRLPVVVLMAAPPFEVWMPLAGS
jgi:hypothetical protein